MNKRGLDLGIGEIVTIILAIAVLAFGLVFIRTQSLKGERLVESGIESSTLESARQVMEVELEDKILVVSKISFGISRGNEEVFLIGTRNNYGDDAELSINIAPENAGMPAEEWFVYKQSPVQLKANEKYFYTSKLNVPDTAEPKDYLFDIKLLGPEGAIDSETIIVNVR